MRLTATQTKILEAVCDTFIPSIEREDDPQGYWVRKASDLPIVEEMERIIAHLPTESKRDFDRLLDLLATPKLGATWFGPLKPFTQLTPQQRERLLQSWATSSIPALRGGFSNLRKLTCLLYFAWSDEQGRNPNWETLGYPGPLPKDTVPINKTQGLAPQILDKNTVVGCDVVVIGSGAAGGVVAAELAKAGKEVIILEKGPYLPDSALEQREADAFSRIYDRKGGLSTNDGTMTILAGACVGGGTTVNWSASFRTPDYILEEWAKEHDNPHFLDPEYKKCFDFIEKRANINTEFSIHNPHNQALYDGAGKLGYHRAVIPRNVAAPPPHANKDGYWKAQGYGGLGDAFGYKQGTMKTFLQDAIDHGAKLYADTRADIITQAGGEVAGVIAYQRNDANHLYKLTISCKQVVVAAGAIHTPVILMRSGLRHPQIGRNLYLHPVNAVLGEYPQNMDSWHGPMMTAVSDEFARLDGNFGYKIETPPLHCGFAALAMPWQSGEQYKQNMLNLRKFGVFLVLTRDKYGGRVSVSKDERPLVHYRLHKYDRRHLIHGMQECVKLHAAAGAERIRLLHNEMHSYEAGKDDLGQFVGKTARLSWAPNRFTAYSAHQMGTCRMGGRDKDHPIRPNGESREVRGLFVADASAFPRCSGVNPMLSIQALAYYIAKGMV